MDLVVESLGRYGHEDAGVVVVGGNRAHAHARPIVPAVALILEPTPEGIDNAGGVSALVVGRGLDHARDRRSEAVGPDHDVRADPMQGAAALLEDHSRHSTSRVPEQLGEPRPIAHVRPGGRRGVPQQLIEHPATRCVEGVHPVAGLDRNRDDFVAIDEARAADVRSTRCTYLLQQTPAVQLQHARAHQRQGREGVRAPAVAVEQQHGQPAAREQHGGGGAGAPRPHHDGVIALFGGASMAVSSCSRAAGVIEPFAPSHAALENWWGGELSAQARERLQPQPPPLT